VCLEHVTKTLPTNRNAAKQRAYRLRRQKKERPFVDIHSACRECGTAITPSMCRHFCKGGRCRRRFFNRVQVLTVCRLTVLDQSLSTAVLNG
jgi:hypothetical protein